MLFEMSSNGCKIDMNKEISEKDLKNPYNPIIYTIMKLITAETFLYKELNNATRNKDKTKIK